MRYGCIILLACWASLSFGLEANAQAPGDPFLEAAGKVGAILDRSNRPVASCFYIDRRGYFATSFAQVHNARATTVRLNTGEQLAITGLVAASRGKDVVILETRGVPEQLAPASLQVDHLSEVGDRLMRIGGPHAQKVAPPIGFEGAAALLPSDSPASLPEVARVLNGDELQLGLSRLPTGNIGRDPDTLWFLLSQSRHRSCAGGPVLNRDGEVVAMMSGCLEGQPAILSAVHCGHIAELLPKDGDKPRSRPLADLRDWSDPVPMAEEVEPLDEDSPALGAWTHRGAPLAQLYLDSDRRQLLVEIEESEIDQRRAALRARALELAPQIEKLGNELDAMRPDVRGRAGEAAVPDEPKRAGKGDAEPAKLVFVTEEMLEVQQRLARLQDELARSEANFAFETAIKQPLLTQLRARLNREAFYLADPLGLRPTAEHEALVAVLDEQIERRGATAAAYLIRAMSHARLGDYRAARANAFEAGETDPRFRPAAQALTAHCDLREGNAVGAVALQRAVADAGSDPYVLFIAARSALEHDDTAAAARYLSQAAASATDPIEAQLGLAWIHAASKRPNGRLALESAERAVRLTGGCDWNSLAALAAARARMNDFKGAQQAIEAATRLAPDTAAELCESWKSQLARKQPLEREWK